MGMGNIARLGYRAFSRFVLSSRPVVLNARLEPARRNNLLGLRLFALALVIGEVGSLAGRRVTAEPKVIAEPKFECGENSCVVTVPRSPRIPEIRKVNFTVESGLRVKEIDNNGDKLLIIVDIEHARVGTHEGILNDNPSNKVRLTIGEEE